MFINPKKTNELRKYTCKRYIKIMKLANNKIIHRMEIKKNQKYFKSRANWTFKQQTNSKTEQT